MARDSKIEWTDHTWNAWHGCKKVSPGCKYCYMYRDKERYGHDPTVVLRSKTTFNDPLRIHVTRKDRPERIFTCSWSDFFIEEADEWRDDAWDVIRQTPWFDYLILTKRPENIVDRLPDDWGEGYPNVWLGVSVESQKELHRTIQLQRIPAKVRFVSFEPIIGFIDPSLNHLMNIDWAILGGESGNEEGKYLYRKCEIMWFQWLIKACGIVGTKVFVKQMGTFLAKEGNFSARHGGDIEEWPLSLQIRDFPESKNTYGKNID